jgi:glycosyltransferase involved in cell wall biosynthesis
MRIAHVVTYISPDGAFGGPVRVALGQAAALAARGHEVTVFAASPDESPRAVEIDGYRLRTFPARRVHRKLGFAGMYAPGLTNALNAELPGLDVVHIHLARDLVTLPAARATRKAGVRLVVQPHGMIDRSTNPLAGPIDAWEVRAALTDAAVVLALTDKETRDIARISPKAHLQKIRNGIKLNDVPSLAGRKAAVLFLARLHQRKRPLTFVDMASDLINQELDAQFILAGPDEGEGERVRSAIESSNAGGRIRWIGAVDPSATHALLMDASVFVLPSVGEVFPMSILEAFAAGTPVVTTSSLGIASKCEEYGAALVTDGSSEQLALAVRRVLTEPALAQALQRGALEYMKNELNIELVVDQLLGYYRAL